MSARGRRRPYSRARHERRDEPDTWARHRARLRPSLVRCFGPIVRHSHRSQPARARDGHLDAVLRSAEPASERGKRLMAERASPLEPLWRSRARGWRMQFGMPVPRQCDDGGESLRFQRLGIADVSGIPRMTVKGPSSIDTLAARGWPVPDRWFQPVAIDAWSFVARTGSTEFWVEGPFAPAEDATALSYPRQDASLLLAGDKVEALLADVLSMPVDLGSPVLSLTQLARVSCALMVRGTHPPAVQLWLDRSYALYAGEAMLRIAEELGGGLVGVDICEA